ncbi:MAG: hypothetical protein R3E01_06915 [Pirellulaceae bacterium]|nr:hypothetical protein [Planctomycetales bacterium]
MTTKQLQQRIEAIERELAQLKARLDKMDPSKPWWERIAGSFEGDAVYQKAMKLGRKYRKSLRPGNSGHKDN